MAVLSIRIYGDPVLRKRAQEITKVDEKIRKLASGMLDMLKDAGGIPAHGNQRSEWDAGCRFDFDNPAYR